MKRNTSNKVLYSRFSREAAYIKLFTICLLLAIVSCKAKKQIIAKRSTADTTAKVVDTKLAKINAIKAVQTNFDSFSGKARTKLNIGGSSNDVTLNIRIKRDQKIWVSITAIAGIEVARALITPDSILVINRLQSVYIKQPFSYLNTIAGNQVNYKTIESLLIGNAIPELLNEDGTFDTTNGVSTITGNMQGIVYKVLLGADLKVNQTNLDNQSAAQSLQVINSVFIQSGVRAIPSQIDISSIVKDKKILVNLHYIKVDFDQALDFPFSIPSRYTPAN
ncbi:DUF4292 domain-containing protein [Mucilaginibacter sp. X4EP1]|uniref:DUF4292 domain-containing protein n=1 Tax=Mucilaginibacter sp. X4EP1 TaxID=2723092 RepID=UPI002167E9C3|nr:DUF4292 domain-containing protein [Mucilaginibacter sp. X4EP1]MCS3813915.1 hypothetical protein [Mucilaginibacter sp. X4EP1]